LSHFSFLLNLGAYYYSLVLEHMLYSTFDSPPAHTLPFYASESPYPIAMSILLYKTITAKRLIKITFKEY